MISSGEKKLAISTAHARAHRQTATKIEQTNTYGRLRPHLSVEESDTVPTIGCTIRPDNGGAIHTREIWLLARPN